MLLAAHGPELLRLAGDRGVQIRFEAAVGGGVPLIHGVREGLSGDTLVGDVAGREVVLVDDMVSTGATLARAANACRNAGAAQVHAAISHGLFNGHAYATLSVMLDSMVVTDTVPPPADAAKPPLTVLSCAPLFAEAIGRLHTGGSVSALAQG
jgi:ribose-phosphate pyrophosphokinase